MAEEFQGGICGGNWWCSSRNLFGSSPCSLATNEIGWPNHDPIMDMKNTRSSDDSAGSASDGSSSLVLQDARLSSSTNPNAWNQDFLHDSGRSEQNYSNILQETVGLDWSSKNFSEHSSFNSFRQVNQSFPLEQPPLNSIPSSTESAGFPLNSASYSYTSSLLQTLFDTDSQPQQTLLDNQAMNYSSASSSAANYQVNNSNEFLPGLTNASPMINPSFAKSNPINSLPFTNNAHLWNAQFLPSSVNRKPNLPTFSTSKQQNEEGRNIASAAKKANNEPAFKRSRIETPSPLPTFKVRKEKLGDRITALQQLVSPFGKTDTASVLHEAIEYIKYLHDQVYSAPYLKNGSSPLQRQQPGDKPKDQERQIQDLKSRGLCLVPISSTFPVTAHETTADFWTPTFGGSFK